MAQPANGQPSTPPDPATSYERAKPSKESPQGSLDWKDPPVHEVPDKNAPEGTTGRHTNRESRSLEGEDLSTRVKADTPPSQVQHSMKEEEPTGWDQAPQSIGDAEQKRHPRTEGKGGVP
jgi:hypothetical protein